MRLARGKPTEQDAPVSELSASGKPLLERPWLVRRAFAVRDLVASGTRSTGQVAALTGLRAVAAWLVWLFHTKVYEGQPEWLTRFSLEGYVGVTIFFVLSGYLITLRYFDTCRIEWSWFKPYARNRFARIFPVYLAITIPSLLVYRSDAFTWFASLTLTGGFLDPTVLAVAPAWSLTVEECFYFTAPFLFLLIRRGFVQGFLLPLAAALTVVVLLSVTRATADDPFHGFHFVLSTYPGRLLEFLLGAWAAILQLRGRVKARSGRLTYGGIAAFMLVFFALMGAHGDRLVHRDEVLSQILVKAFLPWGVAAFVLGLALERTLVSRLLGRPLMVLCGRASYVFYLIHMGLVAGVLAKLGVLGVPHFIALNLISIVAFLCFEEPMQKLIRGERRSHASGRAGLESPPVPEARPSG
jgi:peptidoglycan/LPS O-acetylase OafA/YrhL